MGVTRHQRLARIFGVLAVSAVLAHDFLDNAAVPDFEPIERTFNQNANSVCDQRTGACPSEMADEDVRHEALQPRDEDPCLKVREAGDKSPHKKLNCVFEI